MLEVVIQSVINMNYFIIPTIQTIKNFGIIDDTVVVILSSKGNYKMEDIEWMDYNIESGRLKKIE